MQGCWDILKIEGEELDLPDPLGDAIPNVQGRQKLNIFEWGSANIPREA